MTVYRDRERSVARYNEFRRRILKIPISNWRDLTDDEEVIGMLQEVYGNDVEELDLLVGLMAEKKIKGFAMSETGFFIFLLMAGRYVYVGNKIEQLSCIVYNEITNIKFVLKKW